MTRTVDDSLVANTKLALAVTLATIRDTEPLPAPQTHLWLGLQQAGVLGPELDDWHRLLSVGAGLKLWKYTSETITLTDLGSSVADDINNGRVDLRLGDLGA